MRLGAFKIILAPQPQGSSLWQLPREHYLIGKFAGLFFPTSPVPTLAFTPQHRDTEIHEERELLCIHRSISLAVQQLDGHLRNTVWHVFPQMGARVIPHTAGSGSHFAGHCVAAMLNLYSEVMIVVSYLLFCMCRAERGRNVRFSLKVIWTGRVSFLWRSPGLNSSCIGERQEKISHFSTHPGAFLVSQQNAIYLLAIFIGSKLFQCNPT